MINRTIAEFADPARFLDGLVSRPRLGASPKKERDLANRYTDGTIIPSDTYLPFFSTLALSFSRPHTLPLLDL